MQPLFDLKQKDEPWKCQKKFLSYAPGYTYRKKLLQKQLTQVNRQYHHPGQQHQPDLH